MFYTRPVIPRTKQEESAIARVVVRWSVKRVWKINMFFFSYMEWKQKYFFGQGKIVIHSLKQTFDRISKNNLHYILGQVKGT